MRAWVLWNIAMTCLLTGCLPINITKELRLQPDGKGTLAVDVSTNLQEWAQFLRQTEPKFRSADTKRLIQLTADYLDQQAVAIEQRILGDLQKLPPYVRRSHYTVGNQRHFVIEIDFDSRDDAERKLRAILQSFLPAPKATTPEGQQLEQIWRTMLTEPDPFFIRWQLNSTEEEAYFSVRLSPLSIGQLYRVMMPGDLLRATEGQVQRTQHGDAIIWKGGLLARELKAVWDIRSAAFGTLSGIVTDGRGSPVVRAKVELIVQNRVVASTNTDDKGAYQLPLGSLAGIADEVQCMVRVWLVYERDGNVLFQVLDASANSNPVFGVLPLRLNALTLRRGLKKNLHFGNPIDTPNVPMEDQLVAIPVNRSDRLDDLAVIYTDIMEALVFLETNLEMDLRGFQGFRADGKPFPLSFFGFDVSEEAKRYELFQSADGIHSIPKYSTATYDKPEDRKKHRWHELGHRLDWAFIKQWQQTCEACKKDENHMGYGNPTSSDSYQEGLADLIACAVAKELGYPDVGILPISPWWSWISIRYGRRSLENNFKIWEKPNPGDGERFAAASLLWDLYDDHVGREEKDNISLSLEQILGVLRTERPVHLRGLYEALQKHKDTLNIADKDIDDIFVQHGLFADKNSNRFRDEGEEVGWAGWRDGHPRP